MKLELQGSCAFHKVPAKHWLVSILTIPKPRLLTTVTLSYLITKLPIQLNPSKVQFILSNY